MKHRGRIWFNADRGMWRYLCHDCNWGAGTVPGRHALPWLVGLATAHSIRENPEPAPDTSWVKEEGRPWRRRKLRWSTFQGKGAVTTKP